MRFLAVCQLVIFWQVKDSLIKFKLHHHMIVKSSYLGNRTEHILLEAYFRNASVPSHRNCSSNFYGPVCGSIGTAILHLHYGFPMQTCRYAMLGIRSNYGYGGDVVH